MYFKIDQEHSNIIEVEGFKFRKYVMRCENYILIEIRDMSYHLITDTMVYDLSDVDIAQEVLSAALYDYIENETDELDKIMAYFTKN
ncbi:DUF1108 family protein [Staphylococcus felis]|uniref:DUF1108 family protein n=1 Tax=Staphylococcus felis TaxID=46127 RepID=UPI003F43776B